MPARPTPLYRVDGRPIIISIGGRELRGKVVAIDGTERHPVWHFEEDGGRTFLINAGRWDWAELGPIES